MQADSVPFYIATPATTPSGKNVIVLKGTNGISRRSFALKMRPKIGPVVKPAMYHR